MAHTNYREPGGEDVVFRNEAAILRKYGHEVIEFIASNNELGQTSHWRDALNTIWSREYARKLGAVLDIEKPDLVHIHNTFLRMSPAVYYPCSKRGIPVIQTLHNYRLICPSALLLRDEKVCELCIDKQFAYPAIIHRCYRESATQSAIVSLMLMFHRMMGSWKKQVSHFIVLTDFMKSKLVEGGLPPDRISVKPNFTDFGTSSIPRLTEDFALFIGRLSVEKGIRVMIKAFSRLGSIPLKIVGSGPLHDFVEDKIADGPHDYIELLGQRTRVEIKDLMARAKVLICPSICYEGMPTVLIEAHSVGVPVVASRLGSMRSFIDEDNTGILFEAGNHQDLAEKVRWVWDNSEAAEAIGQKSKLEYERILTPEKNYDQLMAIYEKAIAQKKLKK